MELRTELYNVRELLLQAADRYNSLADKMEKIEKGFKRIYIIGRMTPFVFLLLLTLGMYISEIYQYHAGWYVCFLGIILVFGLILVELTISEIADCKGQTIFDEIRREIKKTTRHLKTNGEGNARKRFPTWSKVWAYFVCPEPECKKHVWPIFAEEYRTNVIFAEECKANVYYFRTRRTYRSRFVLNFAFAISQFVGTCAFFISAPFWLYELYLKIKQDSGFLADLEELYYSREFRNVAIFFKRAYPTEQDIELMVKESQRTYPTEQEIEQMVNESQRAYPTEQDIEQMIKESQRTYPTEQEIEQMVNESQRAYPTEQDIEQMVEESQRAYPTEQDIEQMVNESQRAYPTEQDIEQMVNESQRAYPTEHDIEQMVNESQGAYPTEQDKDVNGQRKSTGLSY